MHTLLNPCYWERRLREAGKRLHYAVYKCTEQHLAQVEAAHREALAELIAPCDSVLDVGCGYGRLLQIMPSNWIGDYTGVDVCRSFVNMASDRWSSRPRTQFLCGDMRELELTQHTWAVLVSIRPMLKRTDAWPEVEAAVRAVASKLLFMEFDCTWSVE